MLVGEDGSKEREVWKRWNKQITSLLAGQTSARSTEEVARRYVAMRLLAETIHSDSLHLDCLMANASAWLTLLLNILNVHTDFLAHFLISNLPVNASKMQHFMVYIALPVQRWATWFARFVAILN